MMSNEIVAFLLSLNYQAMGEQGVRSVRSTIVFDVTGVAVFWIRLLAMDSTQIFSPLLSGSFLFVSHSTQSLIRRQ